VGAWLALTEDVTARNGMLPVTSVTPSAPNGWMRDRGLSTAPRRSGTDLQYFNGQRLRVLGRYPAIDPVGRVPCFPVRVLQPIW